MSSAAWDLGLAPDVCAALFPSGSTAHAACALLPGICAPAAVTPDVVRKAIGAELRATLIGAFLAQCR
jgi:hypothetical protein